MAVHIQTIDPTHSLNYEGMLASICPWHQNMPPHEVYRMVMRRIKIFVEMLARAEFKHEVLTLRRLVFTPVQGRECYTHYLSALLRDDDGGTHYLQCTLTLKEEHYRYAYEGDGKND